ncbi:Protein PAT1-like protein 1 [Armadillidium nasatum]|uniref:Protein PAT1-like protein 1 n=1 Tax=Armadillidium nasatum TaxID=96803 RepID=A0A5N5SMJ0_9CRUS|nr:Protein PAT1-like protein 1 [Armadillidium nasatum]
MESENFFGFDTTFPPDEDEGNGDFEDSEYDALNDETFGSAAVGGDWEKSHEQLASLTEAERMRMSAGKDIKNLGSRHIDIDYKLQELHNKEEFQRTLENLSLSSSLDKKRLYERSIASSPLIDATCEISSSPGSSIWSPTLGLLPSINTSQIKQAINSRPDNALNSPLFNNAQQYNHSNVQKSLSDLNLGFQISSMKTVSEIEEELKRQHLNNHQNAPRYTNNLEPELVRQLNLKKAGNIQNSHSYLNMRGTVPNVQSLINHPLLNNQSNLPLHGHMHNTSGNMKPFGNIPHPLQSTHPLLSNFHSKTLPAGLGNVSNYAALRHPFLQQVNQRNHHINFPNGPNLGRKNMNRNMDKKPFDQNKRYDQHRSHQDQREKNIQHDGRIRRDSDAEWEEWMRIRQEDEYAGLMTPKEKSWLRNIQAMQLQTDNPYQDDYYFVMYSVKQQRKREEEVVSFDGLQLLHDKSKEGKEYEPPRLENSLGKLQVASVNAPRKIIDLQVVHLDSSHPTTIFQRDMRKHRHLLLHVEKLYNIQIELDDLERKIRALPDCPTRDLFRSKCRQLIGKLWTGLINPHEAFVQLLCVRKGKTLTARILSWVSPNEIEHVLATVIQNLPLVSKKDLYDKRLLLFWPHADRFFNISSTSTIVSFGMMMEPQLKDQKKQSIPALSSEVKPPLTGHDAACSKDRGEESI